MRRERAARERFWKWKRFKPRRALPLGVGRVRSEVLALDHSEELRALGSERLPNLLADRTANDRAYFVSGGIDKVFELALHSLDLVCRVGHLLLELERQPHGGGSEHLSALDQARGRGFEFVDVHLREDLGPEGL